jgi:polyvinyl alcohol dehydrogenase (cytochrome)
LFVGSQNGSVYALDAKSGCLVWRFEARGGVRPSVSVGRLPGSRSRYAAYFGDQRGYAYAVDAATGRLLRERLVEDHRLVRLTGSPTFQNAIDRMRTGC